MVPSRDPSLNDEMRRVELPGSRSLVIRPIRQTDSPGLIALFAGLSEDDRYFRFFSGHGPPQGLVEKMTRVEEHGGFGLVAVIDEPEGSSRIVGEASCNRLPNEDGELGITVAEHARGWLGPYLLDALLEEAAHRGVRNLEAEVLVVNPRMLSLLRSRGFAFVEHSEGPEVVRVAIGTTGRMPTWPGSHDRPRLLVEATGGRWHAEEVARKAGFQLMTCPGPTGRSSHCPALLGEPCPLVAGADLVVDAVPGAPGQAILEAHRRMHPSVPVCVEVPTEDSERGTSVPQVARTASEAVVVEILQRLAKRPETAAET